MRWSRIAIAWICVTGQAHADTDACLRAYENGQRLKKSGSFLEARASLLVCARAPCPESLRGDCAAWLAEAESATPSIVIAPRGPHGEDVSSASVFVDDREVDVSRGAPIELDPGVHRVRVRHGADSVTQDVTVATGERARRIEVTLVPPPPATRLVVTRASPSPVFVPLLILSGAALASFGIFASIGFAGEGDLESSCGTKCSPDRIDGVRRLYAAADISLGIAAASALAATIVWLARPHKQTRITVGWRF